MAARRPASDALFDDADGPLTERGGADRSASHSLDLPDAEESDGLDLDMDLGALDEALGLDDDLSLDAPAAAAGPEPDDFGLGVPAAPRRAAAPAPDPDDFNFDMPGPSRRQGHPASGTGATPDNQGSGTFEDMADLDELLGNDLSTVALDDDAAEQRILGAEVVETQGWPTGISPTKESIFVDDVEVLLASGYGRPPEEIWLAPKYLYRVVTRRPKVKAEATKLERDVVEAEAAREKLLVQLVEQNREEIQNNKRLEAVLATVQQVEGKVTKQSSKLQAINKKYKTETVELKAELEKMKLAETKVHGLLSRTQDAMSQRVELFQRAQAKFKRLQIEARNLQTQDKRAVEQGQPRQHTAKLAELKVRAQAMKADAEQARGLVEEAKKRIHALQVKLDHMKKRRATAKKRLQIVEMAFAEQVDARSQGLSDDARKRLRALADAGRGLLTSRGALALDPDLLEEIRAADGQVVEAMTKHKTYADAANSFDKTTLIRGAAIAGAGLVLLLLLLMYFMVEPKEKPKEFDDELYESHVQPVAPVRA